MTTPDSNTTSNNILALAVVFAAIIISGAIIFLGVTIARQDDGTEQTDQLTQQIKTAILAELPTPQPAAPSSEPLDSIQLAQQIKAEILAELPTPQPAAPGGDSLDLIQKTKEAVLTELRSGEMIDQEVDAGIQRFIQKQQEAQANAEKDREQLAQEKAKNVRPVAADRDHIFGAPDAVISIVAYTDFECPFCKPFHKNIKDVIAAYDGKVNWVYRHFPLPFHNPGAQKEAEATECAAELGGNDLFWKYADAIFERTTSNGQGFPVENLTPLAEELGLDKAQFQACLDSGKYTQRVQDDAKEGANSGVTGTPGSILINHKTGAIALKSGALPVEMFKQTIDEMLK